MTKTAALAIVLAAALGVSIGMQIGTEPEPESSRIESKLTAIHGTLSQMAELLQNQPETATESLPSLPSDTPEVPDVAATSAPRKTVPSTELARLRTELRAFIDELAALQPPDATARIREDTPRPADLEAVRQARAGLPSGLVDAGPELFGLSPAQVYRRFGAPTSVAQGARGRVMWNYDDPAFPSPFVATFVDGYLVWLQASTD
ncbi:MAG: hypothetical protein RL885_22065 [Planctomycetota bacterium]